MTIRAFPIAALAIAVAACGPTADQFEQSITESYEGEGYENVSVSLAASEDGGFVGTVDYTDPETGRSEQRECTVEAVEGEEVPWLCVPSTATMEQQITETYSQNGATNIRPTLTRDSAERYSGHVEFQDPASGEQFRHECTVDVGDEEAAWNCAPTADASAGGAPDADAGAGADVKG
ncbi:MAG: hypothetical protein LC634_05090 [Sphingomonadales bacterium]|nr:hypothetical protein [Sphingomonadales bacterium]